MKAARSTVAWLDVAGVMHADRPGAYSGTVAAIVTADDRLPSRQRFGRRLQAMESKEALDYSDRVFRRLHALVRVWDAREDEEQHHSTRICALIGRERMDALFRDALAGFVDEAPPPWAQAWAERIGDGRGADRLHQWVCMHLRSLWMTGIGAIEAAEQMLVESMANANLRDATAVEAVRA